MNKNVPIMSISSSPSDPIQCLINATALGRTELLTEEIAMAIQKRINSIEKEQGKELAIGFIGGPKLICILNASKNKDAKSLRFVQRCFPFPLAKVQIEQLPNQLNEENFSWLTNQPDFEDLKSKQQIV
jgi:hypothetical protein